MASTNHQNGLSATCSIPSIAYQEEHYYEDMEEQEFHHVLKKYSHLWGIGYWKSSYDLVTDTAIAIENVMDLCLEQLPELKAGDRVCLTRDEEDLHRLCVCTMDGAVIGRLPWTNCTAIIPMLENGTMTALEARVHGAQEASVQLELKAVFRNLIRCTVYCVSTDAGAGEAEELGVFRCVMALDAVKALFELYMQYNSSQEAYFGSYVCSAIQADPVRYGCLSEYEIDSYAHLAEILEQHSLPEENRYWMNGIPVSEDEFQKNQTESPRKKWMVLMQGKQMVNRSCLKTILSDPDFVARVELF